MPHFWLFLLLPFSAVLPPDWYSLLQHLWFLLLPVFLFQHLGKSHLLLPALFLWYRQSLHRLLQCPLQYLPKHPHLRMVSRSRQILPVSDPLQARPVFPSALLPESLQCFHSVSAGVVSGSAVSAVSSLCGASSAAALLSVCAAFSCVSANTLAVGLMIMDADSSSARNLLEFPFITSPFLRISFAHLLRIPSDFFRQLGGACPRQ